MHDHDRDLIAALAEETLSGPRAERALAEVARCPECREELAAQRAALAFLESARPVSLTDLEATRLRHRVLDRVGVQPSSARGRPGVTPWGAAVVAAAAILAGLVVLGPLGDILGGGASPVPEAARTAETNASDEIGGDLESTAARDEPAPAAVEEARQAPEPRLLGDLGPVDEPELRRLLDDPVFDEARSFTRADVPALRQVVQETPLATLSCFTEGYALSDRNLVALMGGRGDFQDREAMILAYASASGTDDQAVLDERVLWVLDAGDCRILHSQTAAD